MPRPLNEIIFGLRANIANPGVATTLIQTEDLEALCNAAEGNRKAMMDDILNCDKDPSQRQVMTHIFANTFVPPGADND